MIRVLITGASRGLGLEMTRQCLARGMRIFAACRDPQNAEDLIALEEGAPDQLTIVPLAVDDQASVEAARQLVGQRTPALDWLINNAGMYLRGERPGRFTREAFRESYEINVIGPLMVVQAFLDLLRAGDSPRLVNVSSRMGSIARKTSGGDYSYSSSKTALNMISRLLANDLRPSGIIVLPMHPGWVRTDMGGAGAPLSVEEAVGGMLQVIEGLTLADSGRFLQWDGQELPW